MTLLEIESTLTGQHRRLFKFHREAGIDVDLAIVSLYEKLEVETTEKRLTLRAKHQRVGSAIARMNDKLRDHGYKIVPGQLKRTYRLTAIAAE